MKETTKRVVYYENLFKLVNNLQTATNEFFFMTMFRFGLQFYLHIAIIGMKGTFYNNIRSLYFL